MCGATWAASYTHLLRAHMISHHTRQQLTTTTPNLGRDAHTDTHTQKNRPHMIEQCELTHTHHATKNTACGGQRPRQHSYLDFLLRLSTARREKHTLHTCTRTATPATTSTIMQFRTPSTKEHAKSKIGQKVLPLARERNSRASPQRPSKTPGLGPAKVAPYCVTSAASACARHPR